MLIRPHPGEPDRHDDAIYHYLLDLDAAEAPSGHDPDGLVAHYPDIFDLDHHHDAQAYDDFYLNLDPDLLAAMDPDHNHVNHDEEGWIPVQSGRPPA